MLAKADKAAREAGGVWRVHAVWSLNDERFSCFELTDEKEGERLDRAAVIPGNKSRGDISICEEADSMNEPMNACLGESTKTEEAAHLRFAGLGGFS